MIRPNTPDAPDAFDLSGPSPRRALQPPAQRPLARLIMLLLLAALVLMFAASFAYRLGHPSLHKLPDRQESAVESGEDGLSAEELRHISELMSRLAAEPDSYELRLELAEHFMDAGEWEKALSMLGAARRQQPGEPQACLYLGYCFFNIGNYSEAAAAYEAALELAYDATAKVNLAYIYKNFLNLESLADQMLDEVIKAPDTTEELRRAAVELRESPPLRPES